MQCQPGQQGTRRLREASDRAGERECARPLGRMNDRGHVDLPGGQSICEIRTQQLRALAASGHRVAVLISYGSEWAAWYLRRLAERPANLVFAAWALARR